MKAKEASKYHQYVNDKLMKDLLLMELLSWFKNDFFQWFDAPKCSNCNDQVTKTIGCVTPTDIELRDGASIVEKYECPLCFRSDFRFPRYHSNPSKLLETRRGRCGEWANCFALLARSMKYDVRRVLDWTDHVWVEIFSEHQDRWVHVDPCEGVLDKPLLYEVGWKKELSYVIATSIYEVIDVTPRYVKCIEETKKNKRYLVQEKWLSDTIGNLTDSLMNNLSKEQKELCVQRRLKDLVELMSQKNPINLDESLPGRQSGSSAWRLQRGEVGEQFKPYVWKPNEHECETKEFELCYNVIEDTYIRGKERIVGWRNGLSEMKDLFRKEERDWNMVYLARKERLETGKLSWDIDLSETNLSVKCIELKIESKTYENGRVLWQLCGNNVCLIPSSSTTLNSEALAGAKKVSLTASLSGGKGDVAWQHAQLFRASTKFSEGLALKLKILMQNDA
uniref:Peptide-N(4)-(N-acetyl-beta-glucosaminyl)asparagine amidase n=2 Tax=Lepeophtheirus salmonis TaxID=72036 RepID=A0A0K2T0P7_LEPSM